MISESETIKKFREAFVFLDTNKLGTVSTNEIYLVLKNTGSEVTREDVNDMVKQMRKDNFGRVYIEEIIKLLKTVFDAEKVEENVILQAFLICAKDQYTKLTFDEFKTILNKTSPEMTDDEIKKTFFYVDTNCDSLVDYGEFEKYWNDSKKIV